MNDTNKTREQLIAEVEVLKLKLKNSVGLENNLKAINQQFNASEQQLRAVNLQLESSIQQLIASEQQLKASNQQLMASENAIRESEEKFRNIVNNIIDGYYRADINGNVIMISPSVEKILGIDKSEIIGKKLSSLYVNPQERDVFLAVIKEKGRVENYKAELTKKGHENIVVEANSEIFLDKEGNYAGVEGTFRDVTERNKTENELLKLSTAVKQSHSIITITDIKGNLEFVNPKFTALTGYSYEESIGKNINILKSEGHDDELFNSLWNTISKGDVWHGEFYNKKKNGDYFWESASISPIYDDNGSIINYIKVAEDITEKKRSEQIKNVIYSISNAVITSGSLEDFISVVKNNLGTIIDTTNFYVALYNEVTDTFVLPFHSDKKDKIDVFPAGKTLTAYVVKNKKSLLATKEIEDELVKSGEVELFGSESKVWLGVPLLVKGKVTGAFVVQSYIDENAYNESDVEMLEIISHQISISLERKRIEEDLKVALEKALESDRLKSAFLSNMSHEIRTPMNGILGFLELLNNPELNNADRKIFTEVINKSSDRLLTTINDLIDISKIEAGQIKVSNSEISINKLLDELLVFFKNEAEFKGLSLSFLPLLNNNKEIINTDGDKLYKIISNLIKNAIKYTDKGVINFGYLLKGDYVEFYVEDAGMGIPKNRLKAIFNRFEQADIEDVKVLEGSGLGLAISKAYVKMLGGEIWVTSEEGVGSKFMFTIPYDNLLPVENRKYVEKVVEVNENSLSKNMTVLVVEDEKVNTLYLEAILKNKFKEIIYAETGKKAIEICKLYPNIDVILMDIKMPGISGYEATVEIRKFNKDVIIIAQTAYALAGDKDKAVEVGCNDYITKPINKTELYDMIIANKIRKIELM